MLQMLKNIALVYLAVSVGAALLFGLFSAVANLFKSGRKTWMI